MRILHGVDVHDSTLLRLTYLHRFEPFEGELDWPGISSSNSPENVHLNVAFEPLEHSLGCVEPCLIFEIQHQNG